MWTTTFWLDVTERAIKTAAQSAVGVLTATSVEAIDWAAGGAIVGVATAVSVLTSVASSGRGDSDSASLVR
ncbi:holin [Gordonia sp. NPDC003376]